MPFSVYVQSPEEALTDACFALYTSVATPALTTTVIQIAGTDFGMVSGNVNVSMVQVSDRCVDC